MSSKNTWRNARPASTADPAKTARAIQVMKRAKDTTSKNKKVDLQKESDVRWNDYGASLSARRITITQDDHVDDDYDEISFSASKKTTLTKRKKGGVYDSTKQSPSKRWKMGGDTTATATAASKLKSNNNYDGGILCCSRNLCQRMPLTRGRIYGKKYACTGGCGGHIHGYDCSDKSTKDLTMMYCWKCSRGRGKKTTKAMTTKEKLTTKAASQRKRKDTMSTKATSKEKKKQTPTYPGSPKTQAVIKKAQRQLALAGKTGYVLDFNNDYDDDDDDDDDTLNCNLIKSPVNYTSIISPGNIIDLTAEVEVIEKTQKGNHKKIRNYASENNVDADHDDEVTIIKVMKVTPAPKKQTIRRRKHSSGCSLYSAIIDTPASKRVQSLVTGSHQRQNKHAPQRTSAKKASSSVAVVVAVGSDNSLPIKPKRCPRYQLNSNFRQHLENLENKIRFENNPEAKEKLWRSATNQHIRDNLIDCVLKHRHIFWNNKRNLIKFIHDNQNMKGVLKSTIHVPKSNKRVGYADHRFRQIYIETNTGERMIKLLLSYIDWSS